MTELTVTDMSCAHCEQTVTDALTDLDGVTDATADADADTVSYEGTADTDAVVAAIDDAGYTVAP
ncbi:MULTISPECIES: heavy-metal-associated domain-containing protein [Halobacterium]|uniref:Copper chaperone CopZ n=1 Tax=Halobacterium salinarum (strain ATCC 33171 / DSM 3754 / JCM 8978 / NBRC 102687 / NCIMB 764 / 91-R6) TaxID=2597657 RepID=A0A4D6GQF3_HALS9|nr:MULTISPECIES: heavy-metal-associated domain-containing protein [Halobacterium]MCF2207987.1 heavy-metal-associated domain-containing protein [Halobacterium salinarum]MCF2241603.1 heavy-metal-associated domain-containing protein [Halobacterium salinarum]MDL0121926.1 heavy-metal-associated domain-containing protein [Halobacterium salinarum]MDL0132365.1 heavy-metal-associated domain-containing protein [Halobacterium salinarum]QCC43883.1 HMA domain protein [Halobacterium salinarum]